MVQPAPLCISIGIGVDVPNLSGVEYPSRNIISKIRQSVVSDQERCTDKPDASETGPKPATLAKQGKACLFLFFFFYRGEDECKWDPVVRELGFRKGRGGKGRRWGAREITSLNFLRRRNPTD